MPRGGDRLFVPDRNLKDLIVSYVRAEERSISALAKALRKDGYKFHRLFVTGYLKALADMGILREKEIPPAKVYTTSAHREKNLYELVGERCRQLEPDEHRQARLVVAVLQRLFRRPVFLRELRECGLHGNTEATVATREEKDEARRAFARLGIQIPTNEPAYLVDERRNAVRDALIAELFVNRMDMAALVLGTKQMKLVEH